MIRPEAIEAAVLASQDKRLNTLTNDDAMRFILEAAAPFMGQEWRTDMENAPKDARILLRWDGKTIIGKWLDNSMSLRPWAGWSPEGMHALNGKPTGWLPLPPSLDKSNG